MKKQCRFWTHANGGVVLIKLRAGQSFGWGTWHETDEGWTSEAMSWRFDGVTVTRDMVSDGVDCDGRLSRWATQQTTVDKLAAIPFEGVAFPEWDEITSRQYDQYAELAGY